MSSKKIQVLELLRFLSLTEVFLIHFMNDYIHSEEGLNILMVSGKLGVAFFFMITGYLLVTTYKPDKKGFLWKKITQLLPKYEILLFLIFIVAKIAPSLFRTFEVSNINFIKSIFLIPYKTVGVPFACPMLPVAWTLGVQMALFVLFWIAMKLFKNVDKATVCTILTIAILVIFGSYIGHDNIFLFTYGRFYMLYFITGIGFALAELKIGALVKLEEKIGGGYKRKENASVAMYYSTGVVSVLFLLLYRQCSMLCTCICVFCCCSCMWKRNNSSTVHHVYGENKLFFFPSALFSMQVFYENIEF